MVIPIAFHSNATSFRGKLYITNTLISSNSFIIKAV
ncbi:hypothetical protein Barb4_04300 [Bacteroidales bacterium Barb4]|nr:hypothetical protein Barb4_04300 [Bacteroidales bacterium Barb4]